MKYSLYGNEIDDASSPFEAGLGWVVKPATKEFVGKGPMMARKAAGLKRKLIGFQLVDRGIPRPGYALFSSAGAEIGRVTSGTLSPTLNAPIGIAYVDLAFAADGTEFSVDIRGRRALARAVPTPFAKKTSLGKLKSK